MKTSALVLASVSTCESTVGSVTSKLEAIAIALSAISAERFLDAAEIILAGIVVLIEHREARIRVLGTRHRRRRSRLRWCSSAPRAAPIDHGMLAGSFHFEAELIRNSCGTLVAVEVLCDRRARRRAHGREDEGDAVAFDEAPRRFHGLGRRERVIQREQIELAAR